MSQLQIKRKHYSTTRIVEQNLKPADLNNGQVLVKIDKFALTANNVTYAVMGDKLGYWQFFPPCGESNDKEAEWGVLPVWGFAEVIATEHQDIPVGERLFGYFPPAHQLIMTPSKVTATSWFEASTHRAHLPLAYNIYRRVEHEPGYNKAFENDRMLLFPLHITSFALYDYFQNNDWFNAKQLIILSASSKTSTGLAYGVANTSQAPKQIALTSPRNLEMVKSLGVYDECYAYNDLRKIDPSIATLIVDMSGNGKVLSDLHQHLGNNMKFCSNVGLTHWHNMETGPHFIQERSEIFFAPSQIQKRLQEWGQQGFEEKSREYMTMSIGKSRTWLKMTPIDGLQGMADIFKEVCEGQIAPEQGLIVRLSS